LKNEVNKKYEESYIFIGNLIIYAIIYKFVGHGAFYVVAISDIVTQITLLHCGK
jgi:hypothetical protein